jgi:hypothetical protein
VQEVMNLICSQHNVCESSKIDALPSSSWSSQYSSQVWSARPIARSFPHNRLSLRVSLYQSDDCRPYRSSNQNGTVADRKRTTTTPKKDLQRLVTSAQDKTGRMSMYSADHDRVVSEVAHCPPTPGGMFLQQALAYCYRKFPVMYVTQP